MLGDVCVSQAQREVIGRCKNKNQKSKSSVDGWQSVTCRTSLSPGRACIRVMSKQKLHGHTKNKNQNSTHKQHIQEHDVDIVEIWYEKKRNRWCAGCRALYGKTDVC